MGFHLGFLIAGLQFFNFVHPYAAECVCRHSPVTSGRQGDVANFRTVRQAGAFILLGEEPTETGFQPVLDGFFVKLAAESGAGEAINLFGRKAVTHQVVQEEIVEGIGTDQIFGLLVDAVGLDRKQLGGDGGVQDVLQNKG